MLYNFQLFASFFSSFPLLDIMTGSYKKADTHFLYIPCILFYTTIKSNNSITLNNILFTPASSIHIVIYFLLIKMIYCSGCIIKCRNHIYLDICDFSGCILHTFNHIFQMAAFQFQKSWFHKLVQVFFSDYPDCWTSHTYYLTYYLKQFIIEFFFSITIIFHMMIITDIFFDQLYAFLYIIYHIILIWTGLNDRIDITLLSIV